MSLLARLPIEPFRPITLHLGRGCKFTTCATLCTDKKAYSHTLNLPKTSVPLKLKSPAATEKALRHNLSDDLYQWQLLNNNGTPFIFLDGPPYANGHLHMGHAMNKVLKDFINRYKVITGHKVHFAPGWDCHGLPIEQKALAEAGTSHTNTDPKKVRQIARATALKAIAVQKEEMRDLGIMADWDNPQATYRTMDHDFQIRQLRLFTTMVQLGHIAHRLKPTYYSPTARTALAEAELRYVDDHESRSVYVALKVDPEDMPPTLRAATGENGAELAIWTTTPWSLPSNMGVAVRRDLEYVIADTGSGRRIIIQSDRVVPLQEKFGPLSVVAHIRGSDLVGTRYTHPLQSAKFAVMHADHVTTESGTGLVHMAPVHGHEDFEVFAAAKLLPADLRCPVDDVGRFDETVAERLSGKEVLGEGSGEVCLMLQESGMLLAEQRITHRYPYDWKTKSPTIIRATPQWFADVEGVKSRARSSLQTIHFHPAISRHRLEAFITSRSEWCISRQRSWGVPIPVLFNGDGEPVTEFLEHTIKVLEDRGIGHWWTGPVEDFLPEGYQGTTLHKGGDTLDVWFDSGSAWTSIDGIARDKVADVCLEGSDQHRGWFQSSLLTRLMTVQDTVPVAKTLITHGFITDESGRKMSKSDGNGISPMDIVHGGDKQRALGADALRLWVASVDYTKDVSLGPNAITQASEMLRKLRSVLRFAVANLPMERAQEITDSELGLLDKYILCELYDLEETVRDAYDQFAFSRALLCINSYISTLSALYYDAVKDILYCDDLTSRRRQAVVRTLDQVLHLLLQIVAPLVPHLAEEINRALPKPHEPTIFAATWRNEARSDFSEVKRDMEVFLSLRHQVSTLIESCRQDKLIKGASEVEVTISSTSDVQILLMQHAELLPRLFGTSHVGFDLGPEVIRSVEFQDIYIGIGLTRRHQCPRCWQYQSETENSTCQRCLKWEAQAN